MRGPVMMKQAEELLALRLMALGFGIGAGLFAIGALLAVARSPMANPSYFAGALFFTSAAAVQWRTSVHHATKDRRLNAELNFANPDWQAAVIQLLGTLYFNVMTTRALWIGLNDPVTYNHSVWRPDMFGSGLFLISSLIALQPAVQSRRHGAIFSRAPRIAWANLAGSVFFGLSALGSVAISAGELRNEDWSNFGTLFGALAFLTAAMMVWPGKPTPVPDSDEEGHVHESRA